ncbi:RCC1 domain-containing protein DDB_G0279253-like, partial [Drosophila virilis]|uniref:RCC1 domain-containing protein DDB_G0279253-like n=1 Tax=Drosophila virilis TaxID=7244 RepID=UPI0038B33811
ILPIGRSGNSSLTSGQSNCRCTNSLRLYTERDRLILTAEQQQQQQQQQQEQQRQQLETLPHRHGQHPRQRRQVRLHLNSPASDGSCHSLAGQGEAGGSRGLMSSASCTQVKTLSSFISEHPEELVSSHSNSSSNNNNSNSNKNGANQNQTTKWKSLRAVMAYYCSLRRIKRNGAFQALTYSTRTQLTKLNYNLN